MILKPEIHHLAVVIIGDFNPKIIQPNWLAFKELIQESEGNTALEIAHSEITKFTLDWASFEITRRKFVVETTKPTFSLLIKDIIKSIFNILSETPLESVGINHNFHFKLNQADYVNFGSKLVPFNNWETILQEPRVIQLEMQESPRQDGQNGRYRIDISPSDLISNFGLSIKINDHFDAEKTNNSKHIINIIENNWESSSKRGIETIDKLWKILK